MAKEKEKIKKVMFKAKLEMTDIGIKLVKFRVTEHEGIGITDLHHLHADRADFPRDENFSFDFMNRDIVIEDEPKAPGKEAMKTDIMEYEEAMAAIRAAKKTKAKQDAFRAFRDMEIVITGD